MMISQTFDAKFSEDVARGLTRPQKEIFYCDKRFRVVVAGRRFGKTVLGVNECLYAARSGLNQIIWYIAPTYRMAKDLVWEDLKNSVPSEMVASKNESELSITLKGYNSKITLKGADNPDSLRGKGLNFVVFDEAADITEKTWYEVIYPALTDKQGSALFIGTPKGYNWFYDLYSDAKHTDNWKAFSFTTAQGGNVPEEELEAAKLKMSDKQFKQEFLASFETLANRVYLSFDREYNVDSDVEDLGTEIHIGMDFNVAPMTATLSSKCGDQLHTFDEISLMNSNTEEMAMEIKNRYPDRKIIVYPDPAGKARKTSATVGRTDFSILREFGFDVVAPSKAPPVVDRINEVNALMCNYKQQRRAFIHPRCVELIKGFEGLTYKDGTSQPDKSLGLDHLPDGYGYKVHMLFPISSSSSKKVKILGL